MINMAKSLANFDVSINGTRIPRHHSGRFFPFCGNAIDLETLDITKDSTRTEGSSMCPLMTLTELDILDSLTIERSQTPGKALLVKTLKYFPTLNFLT